VASRLRRGADQLFPLSASVVSPDAPFEVLPIFQRTLAGSAAPAAGHLERSEVPVTDQPCPARNPPIEGFYGNL
jgi:hypothetical protein